MESTELAAVIAAAATDHKAEDVVVLNMSAISSYCDAFVICHGTNRRQVRAIAEGIQETLKQRGVRPLGIEGMEASRWVLLDFGDVVVHVFDEPLRGFYDLDGLWGDAPRVKPPATPPAVPPTPAG